MRSLRFAKAFCRKYPDWRAQLALLDGRTGISYDGMPGSGRIGDPTYEVAVKRMEISNNLDVVDNAVTAVMSDHPEWLSVVFPAIIGDKPYSDDMPFSRRTLSRIRRSVYECVAERL